INRIGFTHCTFNENSAVKFWDLNAATGITEMKLIGNEFNNDGLTPWVLAPSNFLADVTIIGNRFISLCKLTGPGSGGDNLTIIGNQFLAGLEVDGSLLSLIV